MCRVNKRKVSDVGAFLFFSTIYTIVINFRELYANLFDCFIIFCSFYIYPVHWFTSAINKVIFCFCITPRLHVFKNSHIWVRKYVHKASFSSILIEALCDLMSFALETLHDASTLKCSCNSMLNPCFAWCIRQGNIITTIPQVRACVSSECIFFCNDKKTKLVH